MAKVTGPLFSMSASGRLESLVYDRRGFVRKFVPPANPETSAQGNARQRLLAAQRAVSKAGPTMREELRAKFAEMGLPGYRWNAYLIQATIGYNAEAWSDSVSAFDAMLQGDRDNWDGRAATLGLYTVEVNYASDSPISAGLAMFAVRRALYGLGFGDTVGEPASGNYEEWSNILGG